MEIENDRPGTYRPLKCLSKGAITELVIKYDTPDMKTLLAKITPEGETVHLNGRIIYQAKMDGGDFSD